MDYNNRIAYGLNIVLIQQFDLQVRCYNTKLYPIWISRLAPWWRANRVHTSEKDTLEG